MALRELKVCLLGVSDFVLTHIFILFYLFIAAEAAAENCCSVKSHLAPLSGR